ncbi:MAG: hypothetical protein FWH18_00965 [Marinilabiliaceae bacterium]|nr:hypothetical protein [Marinilabiliaceae bacterium]
MFKYNELVTETAVVDKGGAMEADTISKNGRSSKSQTSRGNFLCLVFFTFLVSAVMFYNCEDNENNGNNGNGDGDIYLPLDIINEDESLTFEYDGQSRITQMTENFQNSVYMLSYNNAGDLISMRFVSSSSSYTETYTKKDNTLTITYSDSDETTSIELSAEGHLQKLFGENGHINFEYKNGNLIKIEGEGDYIDYIETYTYDDKKSPFYHCKTPKWWFIWLFRIDDDTYFCGLQNNIKTMESNWQSVTCEFTYNDYGFPLTQIVEAIDDYGSKRVTNSYRYEKR